MNLLRLAADVAGRRVIGDLAGYTLNTLWPSTAFNQPADQLWADTGGHHAEIALLKEIAEHTAAVRALLEDTRNLIQHDFPAREYLTLISEYLGPYFVPDAFAAAASPTRAAERPAPEPPATSGAGHPPYECGDLTCGGCYGNADGIYSPRFDRPRPSGTRPRPRPTT